MENIADAWIRAIKLGKEETVEKDLQYNKSMQKVVYIAFAPSAVHLGNCFLGASYSRTEAHKMAGRAGYVCDFTCVEDAIAAYPHWEEEIMYEL